MMSPCLGERDAAVSSALFRPADTAAANGAKDVGAVVEHHDGRQQSSHDDFKNDAQRKPSATAKLRPILRIRGDQQDSHEPWEQQESNHRCEKRGKRWERIDTRSLDDRVSAKPRHNAEREKQKP